MRPRSQRAHEAVLKSATILFAEQGIEATSMDAIAIHSGVSKATIYKHWPGKRELCLEVIGRLHGQHLPRPRFDSGDLYTDLVGFLSYQPPAECQKEREKMMPSVVAYAARDPEFGQAWRQHIMGPAVQQARSLVLRGIHTGELDANLDPSIGVALLLGPMIYLRVFRPQDAGVEALPEALAGAFLRAWSPNRRTQTQICSTGRSG